MTTERTIVTIEAEHIGKFELSPAQFKMLIMGASVGVDAFEGTEAEEKIADEVWAIIMKMEAVA